MKNLYVIPEIFFKIEQGEIILWDYKTNSQYSLTPEYFEVLVSISKSSEITKITKIHRELLEANILTESKPLDSPWQWDEISKIFHIGTQNLIPIQALSAEQQAQIYLEDCADLSSELPVFFLEKSNEILELPRPDNQDFSENNFLSVLKKRRTSRKFNGKSISLRTLSTILYYTFGLIHEKFEELELLGLKDIGIRKASPSGGGLHPEEAYIIAYRVDDLEPGLYHYRAQDHKLEIIKHGDFENEVITMNTNQHYSYGLAFGIYITARFDRTWWKYHHSRGYRVALLDIGHVAQTLQLCATGCGLNTWLTAAIDDSRVHDFLNIDGLIESTIIFVGAGHGKYQPVPDQIQKILSSS